MAIGKICPPLTSREWREYVNKVGDEKKAYTYWEATSALNEDGEPTIPTDEQLSDLGYEIPHKSRAEALVSILKQEKKRLYRKRSQLKGSEKASITLEIEELDEQIDSLSEDKDSLGKRKQVALEDIEKFATEQLSKVEKLFSDKKDIDFADLVESQKILSLWVKAGEMKDDHLFFTREEMELARDPKNEVLHNIFNKFKSWQGRAEGLRDKWFR